MVGDGQLKHWHLVAQGQLQGLGICRTLMSVLVPEAVVMLLSETCEISYAEALKYMGGKVGCTMIE